MRVVGTAIRLVVGGIRLAWFLLPVSDRVAIIAAAKALLIKWVDKLSCDYAGIPLIEIADRIIEDETVDLEDAEEILTIVGRLTMFEITDFLWSRCEIGEKTMYLCHFTDDVTLARACALRWYERILVLDPKRKGIIDRFELGNRLWHPENPGRSKVVWRSVEVITEESFFHEQLGKQENDDVANDTEAKDNVCYGYFRQDYCGFIPVPPPDKKMPAPKIKAVCGIPPMMLSKLKKKPGAFPLSFYIQYFLQVAEPIPVFNPTKIYIECWYIDKYGDLRENTFPVVDPHTGDIIPPIQASEFDFPKDPVKMHEQDNDKGARFYIDPRTGEWEGEGFPWYPMYGTGIFKGGKIALLDSRDYYLPPEESKPDGTPGLPPAWTKRYYYTYDTNLPANHYGIGRLWYPPDARKMYVSAMFWYPDAPEGYATGWGKKRTIEWKWNCEQKPATEEEDKRCRKGWKVEGKCLVYDPCEKDGAGLRFELCGDIRDGFPYGSASMIFPKLTGEEGKTTEIRIGTDGILDVIQR